MKTCGSKSRNGQTRRQHARYFPAVLGPVLAASALSVRAAVSYNGAASVYAQNFDALSSANATTNAWANDVTLPGWHGLVPTNILPTSYVAWNGTGGQQGRLMSFGLAGSPERAFGTQSPDNSSVPMRIGLQLTNQAGVTLDTFRMNFVVEQWRVVANDLQDSLTLDYQVFDAGAGGLSVTGGWTAIPAATFLSPQSNTTSSSLDGNAATNRQMFDVLVTNVAWGVGQELWLRWSDGLSISSSLRRQMMGVDDLQFMATTNGGDLAPAPRAVELTPVLALARSTQTVSISGSNFMPGATIALSPANPHASIADVTTQGSTGLTFTLTVAITAAAGSQGFTVTNPDGQFSTMANALTIGTLTTLVDFTASGQVYTEDFDTLASAGTGVVWHRGWTRPGWFGVSEGGVARTTYNAGDGTVAQAGLLVSMGRALSHPVTDRALGQQNNSTTANVTSHFGVGFVNGSGQTLRQCALSYTGELWRTPGNANTGDWMFVQYQVFPAGAGSLAATSGWTSVPALTFTSPVPVSSATSQAYDGNNPTNQRGCSAAVPLDWGPGQELWFRWSDGNSNNIHQHIMAVDDVVFTANTNILAPLIAAVQPTQALAGTSQTVTLSGDYFTPGATVSPAGSNGFVTITGVQVLDANTISLTLTIASNIPPGLLGFVVTNPDGGSAQRLDAVWALGPFQVVPQSLVVASNQVTIRWNSIPGANYAIEHATSLEPGDWTNVVPSVLSQGAQTSTQVTNDPPATQRFYRVRNKDVTIRAPLLPRIGSGDRAGFQSLETLMHRA